MPYRDDREALRAQVDTLQKDLEKAREEADQLVLFPKKSARERRIQLGITAGVLLGAVGVGAGVMEWMKRAADAEIGAAWGRLSTCVMGDPLGEKETPASRVRRIELAYASRAPSGEERWPGRCQSAAHQLYVRLHDNRRDEKGTKDSAYWAETLATQMEHGARDEEVFSLILSLWQQVKTEGIAPLASVGDLPPVAPVSPLDIADLAGSVVTEVDTPASSIYLESLHGPDAHVLIDDASVKPAVLCTVSAQSDVVKCRPLPGELGRKRGLRLLGTTDAGAAPLVFAGVDGNDGIYRSDTGELLATVNARSGYSAADGYVAIQTWQAHGDGNFEVIEQRKPGAEVTRTAVKPEAQKAIQATTTIHRSRLLWDKALIQMINDKNLDQSPWVAYRTLPGDGVAGAFHRIADLNWINTTITGCRSAQGMVARFGAGEAMLLFNEGDRWRGPLKADGLGDELRCDGADAVFLSGWPVHVRRCTPAGCDDQTQEVYPWPTQPSRGRSAYEMVDGKIVAAWATERTGVRVRVGSAAQLGGATDLVVFDDLLGLLGEAAKTSRLSGIRLVAAGHSAVLFLATTSGVRAIRIGADGTFAPAKVER